MGLLIAIARRCQLNSQRFEFEHKSVLISRAKTDLASKISDYQMTQNDYESDSAEYKEFTERIERLNQVDKRLDEQLNKIQTQLQIIEAEYGTYDEMVRSNIERMYRR
ncbi:MAG: hypothetical protein LUE64_04740 [Candidatus Gastranaerophilales bacterium]|nr:hypothetical protein [Candidatus Gastranaerophilales bacterium]